MVDEDIYMVFRKGIWAKALADVVFEKVNEYIEQLIQEGQTSNLEKRVSELFDEIGVQTCNTEGEPIYSKEKLKQLKEFVER